MTKKHNDFTLSSGAIIEVVMRKEVTIEQYYKMIPEAKKKGWHIQGFQKGFTK